MTLLVADPLPDAISERQACDVLDVCRNSLRAARKRYFFCGPPSPYRRKRKETVQPKALSAQEREQVKEVLYSDEYANQPPVQVYYSLLQHSIYLCSISTMHRLLREESMNGERRNQRPASKQPVPRLKTTAPNQVWSWDIAKLATQKRGEYLSLYVIMDLFSRHIVAWMLSHKENSALSSQLIEQAYERYDIEPNNLTLHQDRGAPMTAHCYLDLLGELQRDSGMAVLLITHDLQLVRRFADRVAVMQHGRLVEQGATGAVSAMPRNDYTRQLMASRPERDVDERPAAAGCG